jgi:hypothetical protein
VSGHPSGSTMDHRWHPKDLISAPAGRVRRGARGGGRRIVLCPHSLEVEVFVSERHQIGDQLNREGLSPPMRCGKFFPALIRQLLWRRGLTKNANFEYQLGPHEWWLPRLAKEIPVPGVKLAGWVRRGWLHARKTPAQRQWVLWAGKQELKRLRELAALSHRRIVEYPDELITPRDRNRAGGGQP